MRTSQLASAFQPFRRIDLSPGIGGPPPSFVNIREHVMAERRYPRLGFVGQTGARPLLGAAEVAGVQQRLGEIELAGSECWFYLDHCAEVRDRLSLAPALLQQLRGVERGAIRFGVRRALRFVGLDSLIDLPLPFVGEAEVELRKRQPWLLFERRLERALGLVETFRLDPALTELQQKPVLVAFSLRRVCDYGLGACGITLAHPEVGELPEHLPIPRVELARTVEADARFVEAAFVLIGQSQAEECVLMLVVPRHRVAIRGDCVLWTLRLLVKIAEKHVALDDLRILRERLLDGRDGLVHISLDRQGAGLLQEVVEVDLVFGITPSGLVDLRRVDAARDIPQRGQAFFGFRIDWSWALLHAGFRGAGLELIERAAKHVEPRRVLFRSVAFLARIGRKIVQLRPRRADYFEAFVLNGAQLAPTVVISGVPAFGMRHETEVLAAGQRHQIRALHLLRYRYPEKRQGRRHDVHDSHLVGNDPSGDARTADDERDVRRAFVDEEAVRQLAMFTEHLTMIGDHDDEGLVEASVGAKRCEQAPDLRVSARDFGVVRAVSRSWEARLKRFGRFVRSVRVVQVDPRKERALRLRLQPLECTIDDLGSRALNHVHCRGVREPVEIEVVEVPIETLRNPPAPIENECADEAAGSKTLVVQRLGERELIVAKVEAAVVPHAVPAGKRTGHQRRMRGQRKRHHRRRVRESQAGGRQLVDVRRLRRSIVIAAEMIRPHRVERHEQEVAGTPRSDQPHAGDRPDEEDPTGDEQTCAQRGECAATNPHPCAVALCRRDSGVSAGGLVRAREWDVFHELLPCPIDGKLLELLARRPKAGRELQCFFKVRPRLPAAALADEGEPEIEEIAMIRSVARNCRAEGVCGFVEMSVPAERHAESVPGRRTGRVYGNSLTKSGDSRVDTPEIALELTEPLTDRGVLGQKRQRGFEGRRGFLGSAQPKAQVSVEYCELRAVRIVLPSLTNDREP